MENNFGLQDRQSFRINPHTWLRTLLAIVGDRERKADAVHKVSQKTGVPPEQIEVILATTIKILLQETRSN
jgi:hypothetical protein